MLDNVLLNTWSSFLITIIFLVAYHPTKVTDGLQDVRVAIKPRTQNNVYAKYVVDMITKGKQTKNEPLKNLEVH